MDLQFRQLAREARNTEDIETRLLYLHAALRVGFIDESRIHTAAIFGDPVSATLLGYTRQPFCSFLYQMRIWPSNRAAEDVADIWAQEFFYSDYDRNAWSTSLIYLIMTLIIMYRNIYARPTSGSSEIHHSISLMYSKVVEVFISKFRFDESAQGWTEHLSPELSAAIRAAQPFAGTGRPIIMNIHQMIMTPLFTEQDFNGLISMAIQTFTMMLRSLAPTANIAGTQVDYSPGYLPSSEYLPVEGALNREQVCHKVSQDMIRWLLFGDDILTI
ncbi:hypothetical protein C4588_02835 [Candidatus Parcubacteria bacterium]|nr:MAG: hypothetical protein C4588_02835 [Candidatus Parcubacteria bacterium]